MNERLLEALDEAKRHRPGANAAARVLRQARRAQVGDADSLVRLHDAVLFLRAYPHSRRVLDLSEAILSAFAKRVASLASAGKDLSPFDHPEVSGIAGTWITTDYSYDVVRWLKARFGRSVSIDWDLFEATDRLRALWPAFLPLLEEEALEDANVPYVEYLRQGRGRSGDDLSWLLDRVGRFPLPPREKAERFEAEDLSVEWLVGDTRFTRTRLRHGRGKLFFHDAPLVRHGVSIEAELATPPLPWRRLSRREGAAVVEMTREATALRYREYYGFTYADPGSVVRLEAGRGLEIYLMGLERERRLPLRAGLAGFFVKNRVPVGYIEALAFFERIEVGFNIYYCFREGESSWIFARVVKALNQVLGARSFSMDPYQIGHENEEAIKSGAFWFYRKVGFRSTDPALHAVTLREEEKIADDPSYRTPPGTLRRLASENLLYEIASSAPVQSQITNRKSQIHWNHFHIRNLALAVNRRMARDFAGNSEAIRRSSEKSVSRKLGLSFARLDAAEKTAFSDLAMVLDLIPNLSRWSREEKDAVSAIIRAKAGRTERRYLHLLQRHARLRAALIRLGSR